MARPFDPRDEHAARAALDERLGNLRDKEVRLAELEVRIERVRIQTRTLGGDIERLRSKLLSTRSGTVEVDHSLHELGVSVQALQAAMEDPEGGLAVLHSEEGLSPGTPVETTAAGPRVVVNARWRNERVEAGAMVGLEAMAHGFPDGTEASFVISVRGTDEVVGRLASRVQGGTTSALWRAGKAECYDFVVAVEDRTSASGVLEVSPPA